MDAMVELWKDVLLPPNRKLRYFYQQPLQRLTDSNSSKVVDRCLVAWEFEDRLKSQYALFVERLEVLSTDNLDFIKERATKTAFQLLLHRSEQEGQLLKLVVNKLGDPERKAASNAGYMLTRLLAQHAGMKHVVVREIEDFIYRPGLKDRARYYAVVYLNQIVLSSGDAPRRLPDGTTVTLGKPAGAHGPVRRRPLDHFVYDGRWGETPAWAVDPPGTRHTSAGPPSSRPKPT